MITRLNPASSARQIAHVWRVAEQALQQKTCPHGTAHTSRGRSMHMAHVTASAALLSLGAGAEAADGGCASGGGGGDDCDGPTYAGT